MQNNKALCRSVVSFLFACALALAPAASQATPLNGTVYEIFVRSFFDSDGNGVGDLGGVRARLDYLNDGKPATNTDLEVGILWLMPIFPSADYHGYSVDDYRRIDPEYGTLQDFDALLTAAHARGLRVILDVPFNHTSHAHPWFKDAIEHPSTSRYRNYYHLALGDQPPGNGWHFVNNAAGQRVYYFGGFGYNMPDLDMSNPAVREEIKETAKFWLDRGVDGFRLDAAKHVFGWSDTPNWEEIQRNNSWWREFSNAVYAVKPDAIIVGEVLGSEELIHHFAWGLDALLDPPFMHQVRRFAASPFPGLVGWWKGYIQHARENNARFESFPFITSHDENPRLASYLAEHRPGASDPAYRLALYLLMTMGKHPVLYCGDEIAQQGWKWNGDNPPKGDGSHVYDETLREPFQWYRSGQGQGQTTWFAPRFDLANDGISLEEQQGQGSVYALTRALTNFRAEHADFANAEIGAVPNDTADWVVFEKKTQGRAYLVLINATGTGHDYRFKPDWHPQYRRSHLLFWSDGGAKAWLDVAGEGKRIDESVYVPPMGLVILERSR